MAVSVKKVVSDTPSQVVENLRLQFNALVDVLASLGAADVGAEIILAVEADVKKVELTKQPPAFPSWPNNV